MIQNGELYWLELRGDAELDIDGIVVINNFKTTF